jgi:primosomal protein N' (replication factor Y)
MSRVTLFVDVIVPLAVGNTFTYRVPNHLNSFVEIGKRALVQFGKNKLYTSIITSIHEKPPLNYEAKYIEDVLDEKPVVTEKQIWFWNWISEYYMCSPGEVMNSALPSGLKLNSETKILLNNEITVDESTLTDKQYLVYEALQVKGTLSITDISKILDIKNVQNYINGLVKKGIIVTEEDVKSKYKPKLETYISLTDWADIENNLQEAFEIVKRANKQQEALTAYIMLSERYTNKKNEIKKIELVQKCNVSSSAINALVGKNIFKISEHEVGRTIIKNGLTEKLNTLNTDQINALEKIKVAFSKSKTVYLHGVTGSGKTEVYIHLIEDCIKTGKQVLYLLPEIALTAQIINRLKNHFGNTIGVFHSRFSENERVEIWNRCLRGTNEQKINIIIGARSSIFLPYQSLGLIIIDEEHDQSYKQSDPSPRYQARDMALLLANQHKSNIILGSATPSFETHYNAKEEKYELVELKNRFANIQLPHVFFADIKQAKIDKQMHSVFTKKLLDEIANSLEKKEQVIIFQNRRGYAQYLECAVCAHVNHCVNCDVSLTYHKKSNQLKCHYCGYSSNVPQICSACASPNIKLQGFGTEKIEDELAIFFPQAVIARMDLDTTRSKNAYYQLVSDFEDKKIDVLVGTQMITKGLDFDNVSLVGVLNADKLFNYPDFRAFEKAYQILTQVAGRSGRKNKQGKVIIQTSNPEHEVLKYINKNANNFYASQLEERKLFNYPPFNRLIEITLKNKKRDLLENCSLYFAKNLKFHFGNMVLGPEFPVIERMMDYYHMNVLLKINKSLSLNEVKKILQSEILKIKTNSDYKSTYISVDVDPN